MRDTLLAFSAVFSDDIVLNFNEKNLKKIKIKKQNFYSRAGQDGRSDEDKQTVFFFGPNCWQGCTQTFQNEGR